MKTIKFTTRNVKLAKLAKKIGGKVAAFDIRAGHNCPCAKDCLSKVVETPAGRKIQDGKETKWRCYAASTEVRIARVYNLRENNEKIVDLCRIAPGRAVRLLCNKIPPNTKAVRIHSSGDFRTEAYFKVWMNVAKKNPNIIFYAYTKMIPFLVKYRKDLAKIENLRLTASRGGKHDNMIDKHKLRSATVVYSRYQARKLGLPIDINDSHAYLGKKNFALVVHGVQPAGTKAAQSWQRQLTIYRKNKNGK